MPYESRLMMRENETLLTICLDLHMSNTGASDPLSAEVQSRYVEILHTSIKHWIAGLERTRRFDNAVLELCKATLVEMWHAR